MADSLYQVRVRDLTGAQIAVFSGAGRGTTGGGLVGLDCVKRDRLPGQWTVRINGNDERIALIELDDVGPAYRVDYVFEIWRRDPVGGLDWYRLFEGFHQSDEWVQTKEGQEIYIARGQGVNDLLTAEVIAWAAGSTQARKSGAAETVAKEFVNQNIGPGATVVAGRRRAGNFQGLTVQADAATGAVWSGARSNKALLDVLVEIADFTGADFNIVLTSDANAALTFEFQWADGQWGLDRTEGNGVNDPVIFDSLLGNMEGVRYGFSRLDEVNICDVGGPGAGTDRIYVPRTSGRENDSPWARRVVFRDAKDANSAAERNARGDETLNAQRAEKRF